MKSGIMKKYRRSLQRQQVLEYLQHSFEHPTAMRIFRDLKSGIPSLSLGNLYRNLGILVEQGLVIKVKEPGGDEDRFDAHVEDHFHFFCESCGKLYDLPAGRFSDFRSEVEAEGWRITVSQVSLAGICKDCAIAGQDTKQ